MGTASTPVAARYYYAHMAYVNQNYETALKEFLKLRESEAFAPVAPYYITQIYYKQGGVRRDPQVRARASISKRRENGMEISCMVAESFYRKGSLCGRFALPLGWTTRRTRCHIVATGPIGLLLLSHQHTKRRSRISKRIGADDS